MFRKSLLALGIVIGVFTTANVSAFFWPTKAQRSTVLRSVDGAPIPNMLVTYIVDERNAKTCVMAVYNTDTKQIALTSVDAGSCGYNPPDPNN